MIGPKQVLKHIMHEQELNAMWTEKLTGACTVAYIVDSNRHCSYPVDILPTRIPDRVLATSASSSFNILGQYNSRTQ